jgi:hypothetical protein
MVPFVYAIWATSLLYWRHPTYGFRRNLDMIVVPTGIIYHIYRAWYTHVWLQFYLFLGFGLSFYPLSCYLHWKQKDIEMATLSHAMVHIIPNSAVIFLYLSMG